MKTSATCLRGSASKGVGKAAPHRLHLAVMAQEAVKFLGCRSGGAGGVYVDGTLGLGGHAEKILEATAPDGRLIGMDRDGEAIAEAKKRLRPFGKRAVILRENFRDLEGVLEGLGIKEVDGILLDLGVSSIQLDRSERGFSFMKEARLDMRMDKRQERSAFELVNGLDARELERILREYGEERRARSISRAIVRQRESSGAIETTLELSELVSRCYRRGQRDKGRIQPRIHPATRVFQALRIAVNDELDCLNEALISGTRMLNSTGRLVVISFHSLEDRIVKNTFRELSRDCVCPPRIPKCVCGVKPLLRVITKKVVVASTDEVEANPRARSAKLRAAEKLSEVAA